MKLDLNVYWLILLMSCPTGYGQPERAGLPSFDFKSVAQAATWYSVNVVSLTPSARGLVVQIASEDPCLLGPPREYPTNQPLWLHLRLRSEHGGAARVFYFQGDARLEQSVAFDVPAGQWSEAVVAWPAPGGRWRIRVDPPDHTGTCVLDRLWFEKRVPREKPPQPALPLGADALRLDSGDLQLTHDRHTFGAFEVKVAGQLMAVGNTGATIRYLGNGTDGSLFLNSGGSNTVRVDALRPGGLQVPNESVRVQATIIGGQGGTVIPALKQYVALRGLPPLPTPIPSAPGYFKLAAHGWLDSEIRTNSLFRQSLVPSHVPQPAADAAVWMRWLAEKVTDAALQARLSNTASQAIQQIPSVQRFNDYQVGTVNPPLPALVYRVAIPNAIGAQADAERLLTRFQSDGTVLYQPTPGGPDYSRTHYAPDASGNTAANLLSLLEYAAFAGDRGLLNTALRYLHAMDKFCNTVPRGAQTWGVSLHAPDILAAAKLLGCYTLGYESTGDPEDLEQARYWAWTGLPFVYLVAPTQGAVGAYTTISAFGAGAWVDSLLGKPIPWTGLVYADALYRFAKYDPTGPWRQLADGISAAGIQQCWPVEDARRGGLLTFAFELGSQQRIDLPMSPATLQFCALRYYGQPAPYDFKAFRGHGLLVHAAGELADISETSDGIAFTVKTWSSAPSSLLINGFTKEPRVRLNGQGIQLRLPHQFQSDTGRLELQVFGTTRVEVQTAESSTGPAVSRH